MTVLEHLRQILAESIEPQLAECGVHLTDDRSGYTIARYTGSKTNFEREVTVVRDKWWSKNRGRFSVFLRVCPTASDSTNTDVDVDQCAETNLGYLMEIDTQDWKIWATDAAEPFVVMLSDGMRDYGIPWLQRVSDTKGFARYCADEELMSVY